jgi:hypothetical protein
MAIKISNTTVIDDSRKLTNFRVNPTEISVNTTATTGSYYIANTSLTLTLPATPTVGDFVAFQNSSGTETCVIARNGSKIMTLEEDMTIDALYVPVVLQYSGSNQGWVFA